MSDVGDAIKYLYDRFLIRDLLAFVLPGAIVVLPILFSLWNPKIIIDFFFNLRLILFIPFYGLFFVIGLVVQYVGFELLKVFKHHNQGSGRDGDRKFYKRKISLWESKLERTEKEHERFVVLKLLCANNATAIIFACITFFSKTLHEWYGLKFFMPFLIFMLCPLFFMLTFGFSLGIYHEILRNRQEDLEGEIIKVNKQSK